MGANARLMHGLHGKVLGGHGPFEGDMRHKLLIVQAETLFDGECSPIHRPLLLQIVPGDSWV